MIRETKLAVLFSTNIATNCLYPLILRDGKKALYDFTNLAVCKDGKNKTHKQILNRLRIYCDVIFSNKYEKHADLKKKGNNDFCKFSNFRAWKPPKNDEQIKKKKEHDNDEPSMKKKTVGLNSIEIDQKIITHIYKSII